jgi:hypothetical protein
MKRTPMLRVTRVKVIVSITGLLMLALAVAGCGGRGTATEDSRELPAAATTTATTPTRALEALSTTTTSAPSTTTTSAPSTTSTALPTSTTSTTTAPLHDIELPDSFGTMEELKGRVDAFRFEPIDAQFISSLGIEGDDEYLAAAGLEEGVQESLTITYYHDMTVWDYPNGFREVLTGGEYLYQDEQGDWVPSDQFEWPAMGPIYEWDEAQSWAEGCIEFGPEVLGIEEIVGLPTLHIKCSEPTAAADNTSYADLWISEEGLVMKAYAESWAEPSAALVTSWEAIGVDVPPGDPLPPGR